VWGQGCCGARSQGSQASQALTCPPSGDILGSDLAGIPASLPGEAMVETFISFPLRSAEPLLEGDRGPKPSGPNPWPIPWKVVKSPSPGDLRLKEDEPVYGPNAPGAWLLRKPQENACDKTLMALKSMISNSLAMQGEPFGKSFSWEHWVREFCTVRLCGPRRSGHTTAMIKASAMFKSPKFVVLNERCRESLARDFGIPRKDVFTHQAFMCGAGDSHRADAVFVDCASRILQDKQDELFYNCMDLLNDRGKCCLVFLE